MPTSWQGAARRPWPLRGHLLAWVATGALSFATALGRADLGPHHVEREPEDLGDGGDRRERRGGHAARLDLAQGLGGDPCVEGGLEHRALASGATQEGAEALSALDLRGCERQPDHE